MTSPLRHHDVTSTHDTHHGVVIDRAEFDACTFSNFKGVKTDRQTEYIRYAGLSRNTQISNGGNSLLLHEHLYFVPIQRVSITNISYGLYHLCSLSK